MGDIDSKLENARKRELLAKAKLQEKQYKLGYEILNPSTSYRRKSAQIEYGTEDTQHLVGRNRLKAIASCREAYRNSLLAKAIVETLKLNVVGQGAKDKFHTDDKTLNRDFEEYFNKSFNRNCDKSDRFTLFELQAIVLMEWLIGGDVLAYFDPESGKVQLFEAELIKQMKSPKLKAGYRQIGGVVVDASNVVQAYFVSPSRDIYEDAQEAGTLLPAQDCRLVYDAARYSSYRGIPKLLSLIPVMDDLRQLLTIELQSAKAGAAFAVAIKKQNSAEVGASRTESPDTVVPDNAYPNLEKLYGANLCYLDDDEDIKIISNDRPNSGLAIFTEFCSLLVGSAIGLPLSHTLLKTSTSYSAARNETNQAEKCYEYYQKHLERRFYDFVLVKAIEYAIASGELTKPTNQQWKWKFTFDHPRLKAIDQLREIKATREALEAGVITMSDVVPDVESFIDQRSREQEYASHKQVYIPHFHQSDRPPEDSPTPNN